MTQHDYTEDFRSKFTGFCERSPLILNFSVTPDVVSIRNAVNGKLMIFTIDYDTDVKEFINEIKYKLRKEWYPCLLRTEVIPTEPDIQELREATDEGEEFDEAYRRLSEKEEKTAYVLDRVNIKKNQILLLNQKKETFVFKLSIPVVIFLKKFVYEQKLTPSQLWYEFDRVASQVYKEGE